MCGETTRETEDEEEGKKKKESTVCLHEFSVDATVVTALLEINGFFHLK